MRPTGFVLITLAIFITLSPVFGSSAEDEQEILDLTRQLLENIYVHPSASYYEDHVDPGVTAYEGLPTRKDGIGYHLVALKTLEDASGGKTANHLELLNPKVQLYGDFAVVTCTTEVTNFGGTKMEVDLLNETRVWVRIDGKWKLVHFHKSPVEWPWDDD
jgi:calcium/calmodulin-dependent protein kinase (CaM kinase) II